MQYSKDFLTDFANRTKANLKFIKDEANRQRENGIPEDKISVFEVTQLINSFVGLLIFPKQKCFDNMHQTAIFSSDSANKVFKHICEEPSKYKYKSSYKKYDEKAKIYLDDKEELTVKNLILHFRNAIAHNKVYAMPEKCDKTKKIEGFRFSDTNKYNEMVMSFSIEIPIDELEELVIGMCEVLLKFVPYS